MPGALGRHGQVSRHGSEAGVRARAEHDTRASPQRSNPPACGGLDLRAGGGLDLRAGGGLDLPARRDGDIPPRADSACGALPGEAPGTRSHESWPASHRGPRPNAVEVRAEVAGGELGLVGRDPRRVADRDWSPAPSAIRAAKCKRAVDPGDQQPADLAANGDASTSAPAGRRSGVRRRPPAGRRSRPI